MERALPCLTSLDTANALADSLRSKYSEFNTELVDINRLRKEKERLRFTKMEGIGNDYIYFNCMNQTVDNPEGLSLLLSDRHFGIGGDGVVLICPSNVADAKMRMFNLDGSEGKMCGNAIRCVAKYLYDNGIVQKKTMTIETLSGIRTVTLFTQYGEVRSARVDMGRAELSPRRIPVAAAGDRVVDLPVKIGGRIYRITCVSMGNPHCVTFIDNVDTFDLEKIGPLFEHDKLFPERVNAEFVKVLDPNTIRMRVWERGSGETWACGTGACAAAVAAVENCFCRKNEDITVKLRGGDLVVRYTDEGVFMTGDCETVYEGDIVI